MQVLQDDADKVAVDRDLTPIMREARLAQIEREHKQSHHLKTLLENHERWNAPCVLLPLLSPRSVVHDPETSDKLFWERYRQLEALLAAAKTLRDKPLCEGEKRFNLRLICIDNLNVFGDHPLTREEMHRIFDLFRRYETIGVFVLENEEGEFADPGGNISRDTAEYLADVIIALENDNDQGYFLRYLEVLKSRYQHQVYGKHPFKIRCDASRLPVVNEAGNIIDTPNVPDLPPPNGLVVYPSLHYLLSATDPKRMEKVSRPDPEVSRRLGITFAPITVRDQALLRTHYKTTRGVRVQSLVDGLPAAEVGLTTNDLLVSCNDTAIDSPEAAERTLAQASGTIEVSILRCNGNAKPTRMQIPITIPEPQFCMGVSGLDVILPIGLKANSIVAIEGPRDAFKTTLSINFLLQGIVRGEHVLLLRLHEECRNFTRPRLSTDLHGQARNSMHPQYTAKQQVYYDRIFEAHNMAEVWPLHEHDFDVSHAVQFDRKCWRYHDGACEGHLTEYAFKSGMLLPEEMLDIVRMAFQKDPSITRIVLDDVGLIGLSYPFLRQSHTAGDLFLSAFVHLMRNYGVGVVLTGTPGELAISQEAVQRACVLANAALSCRFCDIFGDRYVIITGQGLVSGRSRTAGERSELVPGVIRVDETRDAHGLPSPISVDTQFLQGLVGFDTPHIYRPGLSLHLFNEGEIAHDYNGTIKDMVRFAFARPVHADTAKDDIDDLDRDIHIEEFGHTISSALHSSLTVLGGRPLSRTVVYTVDEFWQTGEENPSKKHTLVDQRPGDIMVADTSLVSLKKGELLARPYFGNVLLLAHRLSSDALTPLNTTSWTSIWSSLHSSTTKHIDYDRTAQETLSCALMDALLTACPETEIKPIAPLSTFCREPDDPGTAYHNPWDEDRERGESIGKILRAFATLSVEAICASPQVKEVAALFALLARADEHHKRMTLPPNDMTMCTGAPVYLCWYSQLREFIYQNRDRKPELAEMLKVCPLPGRGFRGDWFLGIVNGSISINLGLEIIDNLCSRTEEYRRFARGVGLPTSYDFYQQADKDHCNFTAWPGTAEEITPILEMHRNASTRSHIPNYMAFRPLLHRACHKLKGIVAEHLKSPIDVVENPALLVEIATVLKALSHRIEFIAPQPQEELALR
jgi:hypothetical protein